MEKLNPYYISGLVDGEGWFGVYLARKEELNAKFQVCLNFGIGMNCRDAGLITRIKDYFNCGVVAIKKNGMVEYRVRNFNDIINNIIPFFNEYKLQSEKRKDFEYVKIIANIMEEKKHLTLEGVDFIRNIQNRLHIYNKKEVLQ